jgi:serine/threonine-protein kinase
VYTLDAATGNLKWKYTTGGQVFSSPAISGGVVYVGSGDNNLYALDAATGNLKWKYTTGGGIESSPTVSRCLELKKGCSMCFTETVSSGTTFE